MTYFFMFASLVRYKYDSLVTLSSVTLKLTIFTARRYA